ncbi:zonular occludens toxin domain-containing protein, partial [Nitrosomonas ureae]
IKLSIAKLNTWAERTPIDETEPEGKQKLNNITEGSLIVVDEAAYPWPAIDLKDPPEYIKYLSQHRKHGLDFLVITQSPKFVHPFVLENADRHIHLSQEWSGNKQYEWSEYCEPETENQQGECSEKTIQTGKESVRIVLLSQPACRKTKTRNSQNGLCGNLPIICSSGNGNDHLWAYY